MFFGILHNFMDVAMMILELKHFNKDHYYTHITFHNDNNKVFSG